MRVGVVQPRRDLAFDVLAADAGSRVTGLHLKRESRWKLAGLIVNHKAAFNLRVGTPVRRDGLQLFSGSHDIDLMGTQRAQELADLFMWVCEVPTGVHHDANRRVRAENGCQIREPFEGKTGPCRPAGWVQYAIEVDEDSPHYFFSLLPVRGLPRGSGVHRTNGSVDASRLKRCLTRAPCRSALQIKLVRELIS